MLPSRTVAALVLLAPLTAAAKTTIQGEATVSGGWSDAVGNAPIDPAAGNLGAGGDFFGEVRPGLLLTYGSPRFVQQLGYLFTASSYLHSGYTYANRLQWSGVAELTRRSTLQFSLFGDEGRLNTLLTQQDPTQTQIGNVPLGNTTYLTVGAAQAFSWLLRPLWQLSESALFTLYKPIDPVGALGLILDPGLRLDRIWKSDSLGAEVRMGYAYYQEVRDPATGVKITDAQRQLIPSAMLRWRHDLGHFFGSELGFGVAGAMRAQDGGGRIWGPAAFGALRYAHPTGFADLSYSYGIVGNALAGQSFQAHLATLRAGLPLGKRSRFSLNASAGYEHGEQIDVNLGATVARLDLLLGDVALTYQPSGEIALFARYQALYQVGHASDAMPEPTYGRNTILIGINGRYPAAPAAVVPRAGAQRIDGFGLSGIPAPHSEPEKAQ